MHSTCFLKLKLNICIFEVHLSCCLVIFKNEKCMPLIVLSICAFECARYMNIGRFQLYTEVDENLHFILKYGLFEK